MPRLLHAARLPMLAAALALLLVLGPLALGSPEDGDPAPTPPKSEPAAKVPAPTGPGGMTYVPGGRSVIGSTPKQIIDLTRGRDQNVLQMFLLETPRHQPLMQGYFLDRYELTNAQYFAFMQATATTVYSTTSGSLGSLDEVTTSLLSLKPDERKARDIHYWRQLYFANKDALWAAFTKLRGADPKHTKLDELKVLRPDGTVDDMRTAAKFRYEPLPRGIDLKFYNRRPPFDWPGLAPAEGKWNHPVRDVSYLDAQRFAEWAGKHIPTEAEWEYAARGPQGLQFPWGNDLPTDKEAARLRGNWGANYIDERTYLPRSVAVDEIPGSQSWCGALNLVGNVAEWTSSWFKAYPGYRRKSRWNNRLGETIKVVHGSHAESREILVLRPAARNFVGSGPKAPPYPGNRFRWVGFRCAWYPRAGQNHLEPIIWRAVRGRRIRESRVAKDRFVGSVIENFAQAATVTENHVDVLGPAQAIVVVPMRKMLWESGDTWMEDAWKKARRWQKLKDLTKRSTETEGPQIVLGILHTDLALNKVAVRKPLTAAERKKKPRGRGRKRAPPTIRGKLEPGTYLITLWHGHLALANTSLEFEAFLSTAKASPIEVVKGIDPNDPPASVWELDNLADEAKFEFHIALGGHKSDPDRFLKVHGLLRYELGALDSAGEWRSGGGENLPTAAECILPEAVAIAPPKKAAPPPDEEEGAGDGEPGDGDAAKQDPGKETVPGKEPEPKDEPGKTEPGKQPPPKEDPGKQEPGKKEPGKQEPGKQEPGGGS